MRHEESSFKAIAEGLLRVNHALEQTIQHTQEVLRAIAKLANAKGCVTKEIHRLAQKAIR